MPYRKDTIQIVWKMKVRITGGGSTQPRVQWLHSGEVRCS